MPSWGKEIKCKRNMGLASLAGYNILLWTLFQGQVSFCLYVSSFQSASQSSVRDYLKLSTLYST